MKELLSKFKDTKVLVFGDVMLDTYLEGSVDRISPEAPVPVLNVSGRRSVPGGAANVAMNVKGLGGNVILVGAVGSDQEAEELRRVLAEAGIEDSGLVAFDGRPTTVKTRLIAHQQQVARFDREDPSWLQTKESEELWSALEPLLEACDAVIISDYAKGLVVPDACMRLITKMNQLRRPVLVDPKGVDFSKYSASTILTPNEKEAYAAVGHHSPGESDLETIGMYLIDRLELKSLLITRGEKGMAYFEAGEDPETIAAHERKVYDVTGAGDTVIATMGVAAAAGAELRQAAELANLAAGLVVERVGTSPIRIDELFQEVEAAATS